MVSNARALLGDLELRADAIARATPFSAWPRQALMRLARSANVSNHRAEAVLVRGGARCDTLTLVVEGTVQASVSSPGGRQVTFKVDATARAYGLLPLLDGGEMPSDLIAVEPVTAIRIPHAAIGAELALAPTLWQSVAIDAAERARQYTEQMKQFLFDASLVRAASLLLGLAAHELGRTDAGPAVVVVRLPQARLAEMLGISRQWTTALVRELSAAGLVDWHYGRVTVLDPQGLHALAAKGINTSARRPGPASNATGRRLSTAC